MKIVLNALLFIAFALFFFNISALEATNLLPRQNTIVAGAHLASR